MNRRNFLKGLGAIAALTAAGCDVQAMVPPYQWPGKPELPEPNDANCSLETRVEAFNQPMMDAYYYGTGVVKIEDNKMYLSSNRYILFNEWNEWEDQWLENAGHIKPRNHVS